MSMPSVQTRNRVAGTRGTIIELDGVAKTYPLGKTEVRAVQGVSFAIETGDFVSIAGPSGSGKSTILNMIGCIDVPSSGTVKLAGTTTSELDDLGLTRLRHSFIGFIFQSFNLLPVLSVYENIRFPLLLGVQNRSDLVRGEQKDWIDYLIDAVKLRPWAKHRPAELSGGQRQRVAIARALAMRPAVVLADEPTANLDSKTGDEILDLMLELNEKQGTTFVFSTHDAKVMSLARHVIRIKDGYVESNQKRSV